jgi:hypothetical protein
MGSMNWTRGAAANSENLNLVSSQAIAAAHRRTAWARSLAETALRAFVEDCRAEWGYLTDRYRASSGEWSMPSIIS